MDQTPEPERLVIGRVIKAHGIKGEVSVESFSDHLGRWQKGSRMRAGARDLTVASSRPHQTYKLVKFAGVDDRNAAETLRGESLTIDAREAWPLPEGRYYPHQLAGLDVVDAAGTVLGTMTRVDEYPANDVWVVLVGAREVLVPAVKEIVKNVDLDARRITVDPPEGLF